MTQLVQKYAAAKAEFERMEKAGIVRQSNLPWSSILHMVPMPDSSWRSCGDFRWLNNAMVLNKFPGPNIHDFTNNVAGSALFSTLNLVKGYYQIEMFPDNIPKTTIKPQKSVFGQDDVKFLGHWVSASGIWPLPSHVQAVIQVLCHSTRLKLQCFLRPFNFY